MKSLKQKSKKDLNQISRAWNLIFHILFAALSFLCLVPVYFVTIISFTDETYIDTYGYQLFPGSFSLNAYEYLWGQINSVIRALSVSFIVTVTGTIAGILLTTAMGYVLSIHSFKGKNFLTWYIFIPMIFNGGLVSTYYINSNLLHLKDSLLALILPLLVSSYNIIICRTFFKTTIPEALLESAKIDGASQFRIYFRIALPISKPLLATIGLFLSFRYWNDWYSSLLYIDNQRLYSLQALLQKITKNIEFLTQNASQMGLSQAELIASLPKESFRMAMAVIIILPIACVYPFFQKYFITGLTIGAVKG
ncbi:carbohydrate ABC transporter permease [Anaerocolumna sp. MB42-C2]|uniref:carbohydrate ABC transporter permease n=1 Tax=Anaerocolumna sp. MB42-C2 TaxID=3070997 RepID=UPI0027DEC92E|nr:carbohydrate ABC transporter permease [Anaerocolumna sp. MB42-C2]WMJ87835.1 carbohydrate ABC transporter permease [Anaerocolumna sp. MB42-C2]